MLQYNILNQNINEELEIMGVRLIDIDQYFQIDLKKNSEYRLYNHFLFLSRTIL